MNLTYILKIATKKPIKDFLQFILDAITKNEFGTPKSSTGIFEHFRPFLNNVMHTKACELSALPCPIYHYSLLQLERAVAF